MALLTEEKRKEYFKKLNLGDYNKANIKKFQKKYMLRKSDWDGIYGPNTDNLLRHVYNVTVCTKNFAPEEFRCECGGRYCSGYPTWMKANQLRHIQAIRNHWGRPMIVTSGMRCRKYNSVIGGSIVNSKHLVGSATDFYIKGVSDTLAHRKDSIEWIKMLPNHTYTYGDGINSLDKYIFAPYMGNALHTDTK